MPTLKSTAWQIPYFVGNDWQTAIHEIGKIRKFVQEVLQNDKKHQYNFGDHLDLFNSIPTPHESQSENNASNSITIALQKHQKNVRDLMASGSEIWNLWSEWKEQVWKAYTSRYSVHPSLHNEWTRVCMNGYTFSSVCDFAGFSFPNKTSFDHATFSSTANFGGASFRQTSFNNTSFQKASFDHATFSGIVIFNDAKFALSTSFDSATYSEDVDFTTATFKRAPSFVGATFSKYFRFNRGKPTTLDDTKSAPFPLEADFTGATFSKEIDFDGLMFPIEAKFSGANFAGGVSFCGTDFLDMANFASATFRHKADFGHSKFKQEANFENAVFTSETSFIDSKFAYPPVFHGARLHSSTAFAPGLELWKQFDKLDTKGARDRFRTLKNHFKNQEAQFEANLFYALEMRATMREEWKACKWGRAALIFIYDECTAFGLSVFRPLACLLLVQVIMIAVLFCVSPIHSLISSSSLAFLNSFALPGLVDSNLFASQIATVFQIDQPSVYATMLEFSDRFSLMPLALGVAKGLSFVFTFLTLLALRNRFRIK